MPARRRFPRRQPRQARSRATLDAILEATAQILEKEDEAAFNTNRIAARAGVSIGTVYQYFPDKQAILREIARRETDAVRAATQEVPRGERERRSLQRLIDAFPGRPRLRRIVVRRLTADVGDLPPNAINRDLDATARLLDVKLSRVDAYILTRAVLGVVRSAVLEEAPFLHKAEFVDGLLRLTRAYRAALKREAGSRRSGWAVPDPPSPRPGRA